MQLRLFKAYQYSMINDYAVKLRRSNPGSTFIIQREGVKFNMIYICFSACRTSFLQFCRPIIGMDGCWLKGPLVGNCLQLLDWMGITHCFIWFMQWLKDRIKVLGNGSLSY